MIDRITAMADEIEDKIVAYRRDFHRHAELGWMEFRTASLVARRLTKLGCDVVVGRAVVSDANVRWLITHENLKFKRFGRAGRPALNENRSLTTGNQCPMIQAISPWLPIHPTKERTHREIQQQG